MILRDPTFEGLPENLKHELNLIGSCETINKGKDGRRGFRIRYFVNFSIEDVYKSFKKMGYVVVSLTEHKAPKLNYVNIHEIVDEL